MATNQTVESPNFEKIGKEAGNFTSDAINLLWAAINDTRAAERRDFRRATETLEPKIKALSPSGAVNDLDLEGASVVSLEGSSAINFSGMKAPETNHYRIVFIQVNGSGTITIKNSATSETQNQFVTSTGADVARATGTGIVFVYLNAKWREVART